MLTVDRNSTQVIAPLQLLDDANARIASIAYNDAALSVAAKLIGVNATYVTITPLSDGTLGTWASASWKHDDDGTYEFGVPSDYIKPGQIALIRAKYGTNKWRYLTIAATSGEVADGTTEIISSSQSTNATAQWPTAAINTVGTAIEYQGDQWVLAFGPVDLDIANPEKVTFSLKSDKSDADSAAILNVTQTIGATAGTPGLVTLNGAAGTPAQGSLVYEDWVDPADGVTKKRVVVTVADDATSLIPVGTYYRGLKRVGTTNVMVDDMMEIIAPPFDAIAP